MVGSDGVFVKFSSPVYGIRAIYRILRNYHKRGINTISKIINTWAPSNADHNPTNNYIRFIVNKTGIDENEELSFKVDNYRSIILAMCMFESKCTPTLEVFNEGIRLERN